MKQTLAIMSLLLFTLGCQAEAPTEADSSVPHKNVESAAIVPVGKPMLPAYKLPGDMRPLKADYYDDWRDSHPEIYAITKGPSVAIRPVAEYEDAGRLMITVSSWGVPAGIRQNFVDIVKSGKNVVDVYVIYDGSSVKSSLTNALANAGVSSNAVTWLNMDLDTIWTRDYGPTPITSLSGKVGMVDNRYYHQRINDDAIPTKLGSLWNSTVFRSPLDFEGGNFMADTAGNCFCSEGVLMYNGVSEAQLKVYFEDYYGCSTFHIMKTLANEGTTHIDMQMKLVNDQTVLVGEYGANQDYQNFQITNQNAAYFEGLGYQVVRMPMPSNSDGAFRTFINSLFVNGVNMVPVYSIDKTKEAQAMAIWEDVMPTWQHVPMNADDVIQWAGAIHCITMTTANGSFSKMQTDPEYACNGDWDCYPGSDTGGGCDGLTYEGCCEGNVLKYCDKNQIQTVNCGSIPQCGWNGGAGYYDCETDGGSDPSGKLPKDCSGGCEPNCAGKDCGNDGCGGSCGSCAGSETCQGGQCVPQAGGCDGLTYQGCCDGSFLKYCDKNEVVSVNCSNDQKCGWLAEKNFYDCGTAGGSDPSGNFPKDCDGGCQPECGGKECGSDGCGGSCGSCGAGESCQAGQCKDSCAPNCTGKDCGGDGCGGSCGSCNASETCQTGKCVDSCTPSCAGKVCGDNGCGGSCGTCAAGELCQAGQCNAVEDQCLGITYVGCCEDSTLHWCENGAIKSLECQNSGCGWNAANTYYDCNQSSTDPSGDNPKECPGGECIPNCADKNCGDDGCGGSCGTCGGGQACQAGTCVGGSGCGDVTYAGYCEGETLLWCENDKVNSADCSAMNGNFKCEFWADGDGYYCIEKDECVPNCAALACGDDGCGGSCGSCPAGQSCQAGSCIPGACEPDCVGKSCGDDGCGDMCGTCADGEECKAGQCATVCQPDCAGFECGNDGCGGSCGVCPAGFSCEASACVQGCNPHCTDKECGDDSCGGFCGSCPAGNICQDGLCSPDCVPNCDGSNCGPDGCGGTCGSCPKDYTCDNGSCVAAPDGCGNITSVGQCDGDVLNKCVSSQVVAIDCSETGKVCSFVPNAGVFDCVANCIPNCGGKSCGGDGCGGTCGTCLKGESCETGICIPDDAPCTPMCQGLECGEDGCGGSCGTCVDGKVCGAGLCSDDTDQPGPDVLSDASEVDGGGTAGGGGSKSGGCTATDSGGQTSLLLMLLLAMALVGVRRTSVVQR
jgi:agmatine/peptidylarginine deiminase